jgi:hypothetical protein
MEQELIRLDNEIISLNTQIEALSTAVEQLGTSNSTTLQELSEPSDGDTTSMEGNPNTLSEGDIEWYEAFSAPYEDRTWFNSDDPEVYDIAKYFEGRTMALLELIMRQPTSSYLVLALDRILSDIDEVILLDYMDENLEIMDLALQRNLQDQYPSYFYNSFEQLAQANEGYIPTELIDFVTLNNFERYEQTIIDYAVEGFNPHFTFKTLQNANYSGIAELALQALEANDTSNTWDYSLRLFVAAKYAGSKEAFLEYIAYCLGASESEKEFNEYQLGELMLPNATLEKIAKQQENYVYSEDQRIWFLES